MSGATGFDGIALTDRPLSATPSRMSPAILAAILARRTKQVKLMLQGTPPPLLGSPHDMARDLMTLNLLAEGRLIAGFGLGSGPTMPRGESIPTMRWPCSPRD
ncbi:MAG: LLM class flavin-dependent oxidoreductase [Planctomycetaceae bacterium]